jgi:acyl-CoA thioesterase-1
LWHIFEHLPTGDPGARASRPLLRDARGPSIASLPTLSTDTMKVLRLRALCLSLSAVSLSATLCSALFASATKTNVPASMEPRVVVCLGDSLTAGYGLDQAQAYPALLQKSIDSLGWKFKVVNAGLSGETTAGGLRRLDWVLKRRIDVLILALGGNDALRGIPLETTRQNLDQILTRTRAKNPSAQLIVAGMLIPPNWGREYFNGFRALFPQLAKQHQAGLIPFLLEGVGGKPELNFPDGIHPTAAGHKIVAANVWKVLEPVLKSMH